MIDTNLIKDDPQMVAKNLQSRNYVFNISLVFTRFDPRPTKSLALKNTTV